jgi:hypothetical protein
MFILHLKTNQEFENKLGGGGGRGSKILVSLPYDRLGYAELYFQPLCALRKHNVNIAARVYVYVKW